MHKNTTYFFNSNIYANFAAIQGEKNYSLHQACIHHKANTSYPVQFFGQFTENKKERKISGSLKKDKFEELSLSSGANHLRHGFQAVKISPHVGAGLI